MVQVIALETKPCHQKSDLHLPPGSFHLTNAPLIWTATPCVGRLVLQCHIFFLSVIPNVPSSSKTCNRLKRRLWYWLQTPTFSHLSAFPRTNTIVSQSMLRLLTLMACFFRTLSSKSVFKSRKTERSGSQSPLIQCCLCLKDAVWPSVIHWGKLSYNSFS